MKPLLFALDVSMGSALIAVAITKANFAPDMDVGAVTLARAVVPRGEMEALGFRKPETRVVVNGRPSGFPEGAVIVSATAPCGRIVRAGLSGPLVGCGAKCKCVEGAQE